MPSFADLFLRHPREQGESYVEHAAVAAAVGGRMVAGGLACLVHGALPFLFTTTGSRTIRELSGRLQRRHAPRPAALTRRRPAVADLGAGI